MSTIETTFGPPYIVIRCNSHRARDKAMNIIGEKLGVYSLSFEKGGNHRGMYLVTPAEFEQIKDITGISKARMAAKDLGVCWSDFKDTAETHKRLNELENWQETHYHEK
jgi:hypothetical protein